MTRRAATLLAGLAVVALPSPALAQDSHYWSIAYGPVAQLVGGQVIASSRDLSATFYNPGSLAMDDRVSFIVSTESFQFESLSLTPAANVQLLDTSSSRFGTAPSLVAGLLPRLGARTRLAWSFLTRQELKARLGERRTVPISLPGASSVSESYFDQSVGESWFGLTASHRLAERWGVGLTWYGVYRGQRSRNELTLFATAPSGAALSAVGLDDFDYHHARMLAKLGVAYEPGALELGLSITTPSAGLFGSGTIGYTRSFVGIDSNGHGSPEPPSLQTQTQEGLPTSYRSSWAVGAGVTWRRGDTRFHLGAEWFAPVDRFTVMALPAPESNPTGGVALTQQLASVLNAGIGVEHNFGKNVALYGGFRTDYSASSGDPAINVAVSDWNLYHASTGVSLRIGDGQLTLGATGSFGNRTRPLITSIARANLPEAGLDTEVDLRYRRLVLLLGFLFGGS